MHYPLRAGHFVRTNRPGESVDTGHVRFELERRTPHFGHRIPGDRAPSDGQR